MIFNIGIKKHQINPIGKVLDVGCGHFPFMRRYCDITYIDLYPDKNVSRKADLVKVKNGFGREQEVIKMDAEKLKFKAKEFDYVVAGDVLEHTENPAQACKEIMSVGKAGFIRCPTFLWELLFGRKYHLWTTNLTNKVLVFFPKNFPSLDKPYDYKKYFGAEDLHCSFEWKENFDYKVLDD